MDTIYHQTNNLILETQECFTKLGRVVSGTDKTAFENRIRSNLDTISKNCAHLEVLVQKEPAIRRQSAKLRVTQLKYDTSHLQTALRTYQNETYRRKVEEDERNELLNRKFTQNSSVPDTTIYIDHSIQHQRSIQNSNRGIDDLISSGAGILENLRYQRSKLKSARRRLMDVANTLGLSQTTMKLIERRAREDKYIFFGGIFLTLILIIIVIIYFI